jgi:hypothetical protein
LIEMKIGQAQVVSPSVDFHRTQGNRFIRFSHCGPETNMREAAARP